MQKLGKAQKQQWIDFWHSDVGKLALSALEELRDKTFQASLDAPCSTDIITAKELIVKEAYRANGMDELITYIKTTAKHDPLDTEL